jgi:hypothetical protein
MKPSLVFWIFDSGSVRLIPSGEIAEGHAVGELARNPA